MKLSSFFSQCLLGMCALLCFSGCMRFEYTGREYAPLTDGKDPLFFTKRKDVPAGIYSIIGRATIVVPGSTDAEDVKLRLLEEAAARGANAVCIVSRQKITESFYEDAGFSGPQSYNINPYNLKPDGARIQVDLAGETVDPQKETRGMTKIVFKALFLKNKEEVEKLDAQRQKQLEKIISRPAAP